MITGPLPLVAFLVEAIASTVLAAFVIRRNPKSATHTLFGLMALSVSMWATANFISFRTDNYTLALWSIRAVMAFAVVQSIVFALLMHTFPSPTVRLSKEKILGYLVVAVAGIGVSLSPYLFETIAFQSGKAPQPQPGWGLGVFVPIVAFSLLWGFGILIRKNVRARGIEKVQQRYLLYGFLTTFALLSVLVLFNAAVMHDTRFVPYAPLFMLPFIVASAYTIIRHRFMDVRLALARSLSFSFLVGTFLVLYAAMLVFAVPAISRTLDVPESAVAALGALFAVLLARFVQDALRKVTDHFLFQGRIDYKKELVDVGRDLSATIDIEEATEAVVRVMRDIVKTQKVVVLLHNPEEKVFEPHAYEGVKSFQVTIPDQNQLLLHLIHVQGVLVKDELLLAREQDKSTAHQKEIEVVENALEWLDASVIVPLFVNRELTGLILLGEKLSGEPYLQDDVEFLNGLASQAAVNLENARLYKESLEFGRKLESEVKRATHELELANQQLKDLDKAKSEFLSIASHQLYTPLTALRGYVAMLKEGDFGAVSEKQQPVLDILDKSADRLIELIKGLLDISRIERGKLELNLESVDLAEMAKELVQDLMPNAMNKDLQLEFHEPATSVSHVVVDKDRLRQVMLNFVDNAIKYTPQGRIDVRVGQEGEDVIFSVQDTGKGISREDLARLFNKFTRVGGASRFHTEGTGLGLYVARQIVKEHHGEVHVDSPGEGMGSTFAMSIPAEGASRSLKVGEKAEVVIKAAEAQGQEKQPV